MVAIAAVNRFRLTPRLASGATNETARAAQHQLRRNAVIETLFGVFIMVIVAVMGTDPPGLHQQPDWPFPTRFNPALLTDPQLRRSLILALLGIAAGVCLMVVGFLSRRLRFPAIAIGAAAIVYFVASLKPLTTTAYPTTYYNSPVVFTAESIAAGKTLFAAHCASCHGATGRGDGPAGNAATTRPADLTAEHIYDHSDGDLFWWITNGIGSVMPPFGPVLDAEARWNVINFVHANADAARLRRFGAGANVAFPSPDFSAACPDGATIAIDQDRERNQGPIVHIILTGMQDNDWLRQIALLDSQHNVTTVVGAVGWTPGADLPLCFTQDPDVAATFALYAGADIPKTGAENMQTAEFLIDTAGNLRALWYPGREPDMDEPDVLAQRLVALRSAPVGIRPTGTHVHIH